MAKPKYNENTFPLLAEGFARDGLNDKEIALKLGVSLSSYYLYQNQHSEFSEAIKRGKKPVDNAVENALLKRALGYEYEESTTEVRIDEKGNPKPAVVKKTTRKVPPDVGAIAFWLKNRKPDTWKDGKYIDMNLNSKPVITIINKTGKELDGNGMPK